MLITINIILALLGLVALVTFVLITIAGFKRSLWWGLALLFLPFTTLIYGIKYWQEVRNPFLAYAGSNALSLALLGFVFIQLGGVEAVTMAQKIDAGTLTEQEAARFMQANLEGMERLGAGGRDEMVAQMRADSRIQEAEIQQFEQMFEQIDAVARGEQASFQAGSQEGAPLQLAMADVTTEEDAGMETLEAEIAAIEARMAQLDAGLDAPVEAPPAGPDAASPPSVLGLPLPDYVESPIKEVVAYQKKDSGAIAMAEAEHYIGDILSVTTREGIARRATLNDVHPDRLEFQRHASGGFINYTIPRREIRALVLD